MQKLFLFSDLTSQKYAHLFLFLFMQIDAFEMLLTGPLSGCLFVY